MNEFTPIFLRESVSMLHEWEDACLEVVTESTPASLERLLIAAHNLKGGASMAGFADIRDLIHQAEKLIEELTSGKAASTVGTVHILMQLPPAIRQRLQTPTPGFSLSGKTSVRQLLKVLKVVVEEEAGRLGLSLDVMLKGEDFFLASSTAERLTVPLTHLLRNALVHGIADQPKIRPTLRLTSTLGNREFSIEVADTGNIDERAIFQQAIKRGLLAEDSRPLREDLLNLIFLPGFSSKADANGLGGRGMGMTIVKQKVEALSGRVEVTSEAGKGTAFRIVLPLEQSGLKAG